MKIRINILRYILLLAAGLPFLSKAQVVKPNGATQPVQVTPLPTPGAFPLEKAGTFIRVYQPKKSYTDAGQVNKLSGKDNVTESTTYLDAMGREIQTVMRQYSPDGKDGITARRYDSYGREAITYMPYTAEATNGEFRQEPFNESVAFNTAMYPGEKVFYGTTSFDNSPLHTVEKKTAPGNSWEGSGKGIVVNERAVRAAEGVRKWTIAATANAVPVSNSTYGAGELAVKEITDEQNSKVLEYVDEQGRVILTKKQVDATAADGHTGWLCTYSVYDDMNRLRAVIPPAAVEAIKTNWNLGLNNIFTELCHYFEHDELGRTVYKKLPGVQPLEIVYDNRDRVVFIREGIHKRDNYWMVKFYDAADREVMTAVYNSTATRTTLQAQMNAVTGSQQSVTHTIPGVGDLVLATYESGQQYKARSSITFTDGFETPDGANIETIIDPAFVQSTEIVLANNPLPNIPAASLTPLTYSYYDNYNFPGADAYVAAYAAKNSAGENLHAETSGRLPRALHMLTGHKTRVLGTDTWLNSTQHYDSRYRLLQQISGNIAGGKDYTTLMYNFSGAIISRYEHHKNPKSGQTPDLRILTLNTYDHAGRLKKVRKQLNDAGALKTISEYLYNSSGTLLKKTLGNNIESLDYTYNVRGWLTGVNRDFARTGTGHYFGFELCYDYGFTQQNLSGVPAGVTWRSKGDNAWRAYGYTYDLANRLKKADFTQRNSEWNTADGVDYTVSNITYDANGNIRTMNSNGLLGTTSGTVDNLTYTYENNNLSNKLLAVTDGAGFRDKGDFNNVNTTADDYTYDPSGNLTRDKNKSISNIVYNHLNKADFVDFGTKGSIRYYFDAAGNKVQMITKENGKPDRITDYIGSYVYENDQLKIVPQEEGRIRPVYVSGSPVTYTYDYFILDYQSNVRMILTEQTDWQLYTATMEQQAGAFENALFSNIDATRNAKPSGYPETQEKTENESVARLNAKDENRKIGPSIVLRVTAGDTVTVGVRAFFKSMQAKNGKTQAPAEDMLGALISAFGDGGAQPESSHGSAATAVNNSPFNNDFNNSYQRLKEREPSNADPNKPKAYLNFVLFDDQFKLVDECSGVKQVKTADELETLGTKDLQITKTGFLYVYVSNESQQDVYFDNLTVLQETGPVMEENHYYPFGMTMAGISSNAPDKVKNRYKYNSGTELTDDLDLNIYETPFRWYDAQLGRFHSMDPLAVSQADQSPYKFARNNPVYYNDPWGDIEIEVTVSQLDAIYSLFNSKYGGSWSASGGTVFYQSMSAELGGHLLGAPVHDDGTNYSFTVGGYFKDAAGYYNKTNEWGTEYYGTFMRITIPKLEIDAARLEKDRMEQEAKADEKWEYVHTALDVAGSVPGFGELADLSNAVLYAARGKTFEASVSVAAALGVGEVLKASRLGRKIIHRIQRHHIIPRAVATEYADELAAINWNNEASANLKKLITPFHGNHPAYSAEVSRRIKILIDQGALNTQNMDNLVKDLRREITDAWGAYKNGLGNLNDFFKKYEQ